MRLILKAVSQFFLLSLIFSATGLYAQEVELNQFVLPAAENGYELIYPLSQLRKNNEGWVDVQFMVGTDGKAFEMVIVDSIGDDSFGVESLKTLSSIQFKPATLNGEPIVASLQTTYRFVLEGATGANRGFVRKYRDFMEANDRSASQAELQELLDLLINENVQNHYEHAFLSWAQYLFLEEYGTSLDSLNYLRKIALLEEDPEQSKYLSPDIVKFARRAQFNLELENYMLGEAIEVFHMIEESKDMETIESLQGIYEVISTYRENEVSYPVNMVLDMTGKANILLYKHKFFLQDVVGQVVEAKLLCDMKYLAFSVEPEVSYDIPTSYGDCLINFVGDSESTFVLVQH